MTERLWRVVITVPCMTNGTMDVLHHACRIRAVSQEAAREQGDAPLMGWLRTYKMRHPQTVLQDPVFTVVPELTEKAA